ncbi:MAG: cytochrome C peroxidase, partial [Gammaproteobacteria bacterium]
MKNPCASNSGQFIDPADYIRPVGSKRYKHGHISKRTQKKLVQYGKKLFNDPSLSGNGISCSSCHATDHLFKASFATPYPHKVQMTADFSRYQKPVELEEFVQFCMLKPMASKAFPWKSKELAALTAYMEEKKHKPFMQMAMANPCALKHRGAMKNPCAM